MKKIALGNSSTSVSCIALGTMYYGSKIAPEVAFDQMDLYVEYGGSLLDSANKYASWIDGCKGGESELVIGEWMRQRANRKEMFITSKVGFAYGDVDKCLRREVIISECEKSLKRLQTDYIDLFFAHCDDFTTPQEEYLEALYNLKRRGLICHLGASNFSAWRLARANALASDNGMEQFCAVQQRHTLLDPSLRANTGNQVVLTPEMEQYCDESGVTIMGFSPLLGGSYLKSYDDIPADYKNTTSHRKFTALQIISEQLQCSPNAVVLAWMIQGSPTVIPIVAGSRVLQLKENFDALSITLTNKQIMALNGGEVEVIKY